MVVQFVGFWKHECRIPKKSQSCPKKRLFPLLLFLSRQVCIEDTTHSKYRMQRNKAFTELEASSLLPESNIWGRNWWMAAIYFSYCCEKTPWLKASYRRTGSHWLIVQEELNPSWWGRHSMHGRKLDGHIFIHTEESEKANRKYGQILKL